MKKIAILTALVVFVISLGSCESTDLNEETYEAELDQLEIFQVDPGEIQRPGEQGDAH